jgi:hypothetical protein
VGLLLPALVLSSKRSSVRTRKTFVTYSKTSTWIQISNGNHQANPGHISGSIERALVKYRKNNMHEQEGMMGILKRTCIQGYRHMGPS